MAAMPEVPEASVAEVARSVVMVAEGKLAPHTPDSRWSCMSTCCNSFGRGEEELVALAASLVVQEVEAVDEAVRSEQVAHPVVEATSVAATAPGQAAAVEAVATPAVAAMPAVAARARAESRAKAAVRADGQAERNTSPRSSPWTMPRGSAGSGSRRLVTRPTDGLAPKQCKLRTMLPIRRATSRRRSYRAEAMLGALAAAEAQVAPEVLAAPKDFEHRVERHIQGSSSRRTCNGLCSSSCRVDVALRGR